MTIKKKAAGECRPQAAFNADSERNHSPIPCRVKGAIVRLASWLIERWGLRHE